MKQARDRSAYAIIIVALALFIIRWPLDNISCSTDARVWGGTHPKTGSVINWRPPATEGTAVFDAIFRGGGGTPAVFAMLGGQRYMVANILWDYSDVLFHQGKPYQMVSSLESTVTLNPTFTEAWSLYGWHLAWNLQTYTTDLAQKAKWLRAGEVICKRAIESNPLRVRPYFDLAWLRMQRKHDFEGALEPLQKVVESGQFEPLTPTDRKRANREVISETKWDPRIFGHRLAYVYKKLGIITGDVTYFEKAIATYRRCLEIDPDDKNGQENMAKLQRDYVNPEWIAEQREIVQKDRERYGMGPVQFPPTPDEAFRNRAVRR
jgi:tetratricopeptide (TPR) repeat protein